MKNWFNIVVIALTMALGSYVMAADAPASTKPLRGKVTAIAPDSADSKITDITISHGKKGDTTDTVVKATADTKVTKGKEKEAATLADVVVGAYISVTPDADSKVAEIQIFPSHKKSSAPASK